jgi:SHS2 domain-containing protein
MDSRVHYLDHPSDIGIEAHGATRADAFSRAAAALISLLIDPSSISGTQQRSVTLSATDEEQLLVRWLSEVLFLYDGLKFVSKEFAFSSCTATALEARVMGEAYDPGRHLPRTDIKAVTYHQLAVWHDEAGWGVRVFLDV